MYNTSSPVIYTIIITYNGARWIRTCLSALAHSSVHGFTIVVDNASTDDTVGIIQNEFPYVELVQNAANRGFGAANNQAMETAMQRGADFVLLLNQDAYVYTNTIEQLLAVMRQQPQYGIMSPVQVSGDGQRLDAGFKTYLRQVCSDAELQAMQLKSGLDKMVIPVRFVNAACWLLRAGVIKTTGYFHPLFFHYGEDNNYSSRAQYHGFLVGICPNCYVTHDREPATDRRKVVLRKIKTTSRYSATDIRKSFAAAYIQAVWKYFLLRRKTAAYKDPVIRIALEEEWNFLKNVPAIKNYRSEMKQALQL